MPTPAFGFRFPQDSDPPDVPEDILALAEDVEAEILRVDDDIADAADLAESALFGWQPITQATIDNESFFDVDLTDGGRWPAGTFHLIRLFLRGTLDDAADIWCRINNTNPSANSHRSGNTIKQYSNGSETPFRGDANQWRVGRWTTSPSTCELLIFRTSVTTTVGFQATAVTAGGESAHLETRSGGRILDSQLTTSVRFGRLSPSSQYNTVQVIAEGFRP